MAEQSSIRNDHIIARSYGFAISDAIERYGNFGNYDFKGWPHCGQTSVGCPFCWRLRLGWADGYLSVICWYRWQSFDIIDWFDPIVRFWVLVAHHLIVCEMHESFDAYYTRKWRLSYIWLFRSDPVSVCGRHLFHHRSHKWSHCWAHSREECH